MLRFLRKIDEVIFKIEKNLLILVLGLMVIFAVFGMSSRNISGKDYPFIGDFLQNGVLWLAFIGGSMGSRFNKHINVNIFPTYLEAHPSMHKVFEIITSAFTALVAIILCFSAYQFIKMEYVFGEDIPSMGIKLWIVQSVLIYAWMMVFFRFTMRFLELIMGQPLPEEEEKKMEMA